jgi:hypothetical protein
MTMSLLITCSFNGAGLFAVEQVESVEVDGHFQYDDHHIMMVVISVNLKNCALWIGSVAMYETPEYDDHHSSGRMKFQGVRFSSLPSGHFFACSISYTKALAPFFLGCSSADMYWI